MHLVRKLCLNWSRLVEDGTLHSLVHLHIERFPILDHAFGERRDAGVYAFILARVDTKGRVGEGIKKRRSGFGGPSFLLGDGKPQPSAGVVEPCPSEPGSGMEPGQFGPSQETASLQGEV